MNYLVKMTPLEPYSFGNDQNFVYPDEKSTGKESYFVRSKEVPEQTTILGLLRYLILQETELLRTNFQYTPQERQQMKLHIGERSFSYLEKERQDFGDIHEISPVFLLNEKEEILVKNPYHNKAKESGYVPMRMEASVETSHGIISLPAAGEYDGKEGYAGGYINLETGIIERNLFGTQIVSGNRKKERGGSDEDGFFKREMKCLEEGYSFGVYVDAEGLPAKTIGYMGKKRSAFLIETREVRDTGPDVCHLLKAKVEVCFAGQHDTWFYALSDLVLQEPAVFEEFCIVEEKYQRNLETVYSVDSRLKKLKKSEIRHHLIQSGSVFYKHLSLPLEHANCQQIGYNKVIRLGGC